MSLDKAEFMIEGRERVMTDKNIYQLSSNGNSRERIRATVALTEQQHIEAASLLEQLGPEKHMSKSMGSSRGCPSGARTSHLFRPDFCSSSQNCQYNTAIIAGKNSRRYAKCVLPHQRY